MLRVRPSRRWFLPIRQSRATSRRRNGHPRSDAHTVYPRRNDVLRRHRVTVFFFPKTLTRLYGATVVVSEMKKTRSVFGTRLPLRSGFTLTLLMVFILKETKNHKCTEAVAIRFHVGSTALYIDGSNSSLIDIKYLKTLDISCLQGWANKWFFFFFNSVKFS